MLLDTLATRGAPVLALSALATLAFVPARTGAPAPRADVAPRPALAEPAMSPDRREIAFTSGGDLWVVPAAGGTATLLVSHPAHEARPLWSPDGTRLAFTSTRTGNGDVYVLTLATGALQRITFDDQGDQLDAWSRDGRWLYFSSTSRDIAGMNDVWRVAATGGTPQQVAADRYANEYWAQPSPSDAGTLAITARGLTSGQWWRRGHSHIDESEIWMVRDVAPGAAASGGAPRYAPVTHGGAKDMWPMWAADGRTLYFVRDTAGVQNVWTVGASGGTATRVTSFRDGRVLWPTMSYDGRTITFERDFRLWTLDVASKEVREVPVTLRGASATTGPEHVSLSQGFQEVAVAPDGRKVAFVARGEVFAASAKDGGDGERLTRTPGATEGQLAWLPDSRRLLYMSDRDGAWRLWMWDFATAKETQLTRGDASDAEPELSPDGKLVAFVRGGRELRVLDLATRQERVLARGVFDRWPFLTDGAMAWSPDGKWLAYWNTGTRLLSNVFVVPAAGGEPRQVSFLPNTNGGSLRWSPDGTYLLAVSGQRTEPGVVVRIDLQPRTPRFREDQFRELFRDPGSPRPNVPSPQPGTPSTPTPSRDTAATARTARVADSAARTTPARSAITIDFDGIRQRLTIVPVGVDVGNVTVSPDGKTMLMVASAAGQQNLYTWSLDELARETPVARQLTSTAGFKSSVQWSADSKEVWYLENGRIVAMPVESRQARPLAVNAELDVDFAAEKAAVFEGGWRVLDDWFYDEKFHGVDWTRVRDAYAPVAAGARTQDELRRVMNVMIGELNASHTGAGGPGFNPGVTTGRLGLRFDRAAYERDGRLVVTEIIPLSPAATSRAIEVGDRVASVDGQPVDARTNLDSLLTFRIGRRVVLGVARGGAGASGTREVAVRPANATTEKGLLYRGWVESRRAYVEKASGGRLGYVHMLDMGAPSLTQLQLDLDAMNMAREGVVIDVRNNNGGFVNAYALDIFTRRGYMSMQPRGAPRGNARTVLGQRSLELPTALVTNQHSLSDAEDFTEGYRALKLGPVIGEPTAGWIIYTSNITLLDGTSVRVPFTRITDQAGKDMELVPRPVDVPVKRPIGEWYSGRDAQLDAAVTELLGRLGKVAGR